MQSENANEDFTNVKFGSLTALRICKDKIYRKYYVCRCDCGNIKSIRLSLLKNNRVVTCGCQINKMTNNDPKLSNAKKVWRKYNEDNLSFEDFYRLSQMDCFYCKSKPKNKINKFTHGKRKESSKFSGSEFDFVYNGLDRVDSSRGHELDNVVSCCKKCNSFKMDMSAKDFKIHLKKTAANHIYKLDPEILDKIIKEWKKKNKKKPGKPGFNK